MYDTVNLVLYQYDVADVNFLEDIPQYLTIAKKYVDSEGNSSVKGKLGSLDVYINHKKMKIYGSLCKYFHGNNAKALPLQEARVALLGIGETLGIPLDQAAVTRLDLAANFGVASYVEAYFSLLYEYKRSKKITFNKTGIYFKTNDKELAFYDKNKEMRGKNANHLFRYELKLIVSIR